MQIHGFNKTTLLDYPEHVAATIFTGGCNFRCPFCQNGDLVLNPQSQPLIMEDEIFTTLKKRQGILSGVCITGGEPTLQPDLAYFIRKIKELGYLVKLDTNGYHPDIIADLYEHGLIDYVAMDIKTSPCHYSLVSGVPHLKMDPIFESVRYLMNCGISYEFRTTVVRELHCADDFREIGAWLAGCRAYYLQGYQESDSVICPGYTAFDKEELLTFLEILRPFIPNAALRGVD